MDGMAKLPAEQAIAQANFKSTAIGERLMPNGNHPGRRPEKYDRDGRQVFRLILFGPLPFGTA